MKNKNTKIVIVSFSLLLMSNTVFASGETFATYLHTPEDLNEIHFLQYNHDYNNIDTPNQIVFEGLDKDQLLPLYRKLIDKPFPSDVKKILYGTDYDALKYPWTNDNYKSPKILWREARNKIMNDTVILKKYNDYSSEDRSDDCLDTTYNNAISVLNDRKNKYSKSDLKEWIKNQDAVFSGCKDNGEDYYEHLKHRASLALSFASQNSDTKLVTSESAGAVEHKGFFRRIADFFIRLWQRIFHNVSSENMPALLNTCNSGVCVLDKKYEGQLQYDYEYQQAIQSLYTDDLLRTEAYLKYIGNEKDSTWNMQATYLLGGFYVEQYQGVQQSGFSDNKEYKNQKEKLLSFASEQYNKVLTNKDWQEIHKKAQGMLDYILSQKDEVADLEKQTKILENSNDPVAVKEALDNFVALWYDKKEQSDDKFNQELLSRGDNLTLWLDMWVYQKAVKLNVLKEKYKEANNDAWLLALARYTPITDSSFKQIENDVQNLSKSSLAYWSANYYIIKKEADAGNIPKAKIMLSKLDTSDASNGVTDFMQNLKMQTASSLEELFKYSERHIYEVAGYYTNERQDKVISQIAFMDNKAKAIFESKLPLAKQVELLSSETLFSKKQTEFLRLFTFLRATLLQDWANADILANQLAKNNTDIKNDLAPYINAKSEENKKYYSASFLIKYVGIGFNLYDDVLIDKSVDKPQRGDTGYEDWETSYTIHPMADYKDKSEYGGERWHYCQPISTAYVPNKYYGDKNTIESDWYDSKDVPELTSHFGYNLDFSERIITKEDQKKAKEELEKVFKVDRNYFSQIILDYANTHPSETTVPETLRQIVRFGRFGDCLTDMTHSYSEKAFKLLHKKYPNSEWAKKTTSY